MNNKKRKIMWMSKKAMGQAALITLILILALVLFWLLFGSKIPGIAKAIFPI